MSGCEGPVKAAKQLGDTPMKCPGNVPYLMRRTLQTTSFIVKDPWVEGNKSATAIRGEVPP